MTLHKLVETKVNVGVGCCEVAMVDIIGRVMTMRLTKLHNAAGGGKEKQI
jgi:hypothetical protein